MVSKVTPQFLMVIITIVTIINQISASSMSGMRFRSSGWSQHQSAQAAFQPWQVRHNQYPQQQQNYYRQQQYDHSNSNSNSNSNSGVVIRRPAPPNPFYRQQAAPQPDTFYNQGQPDPFYNQVQPAPQPDPFYNQIQPSPQPDPFYNQPDPFYDQPTVVNPAPVPAVYPQPSNPNPFYDNNQLPVIPNPEQPLSPNIPPVPIYLQAEDPHPDVIVVKVQKPMPTAATPIIYDDLDPVVQPVPTPDIVIVEPPMPTKEAKPIIYDDMDPETTTTIPTTTTTRPTTTTTKPPTTTTKPPTTTTKPPTTTTEPPTTTTKEPETTTYLDRSIPNRGDAYDNNRGSPDLTRIFLGQQSSNDINSINNNIPGTFDFLVGADPNLIDEGPNDLTNRIISPENPTVVETKPTFERDPKLDQQILDQIFGTGGGVFNTVLEPTTPGPDVRNFINSLYENGNPFAMSGTENINRNNIESAPVDFGATNAIDSKTISVQHQPFQVQPPVDNVYTVNSPPFELTR